MLAGILAGATLAASGQAGEPATVRVEKAAEGWRLLRDGKPYFVRGAGGSDYLETLKASGGNSIRTWGADEKTGALLDRAHRLGLTVTLGLWLGHERHGFRYDDPEAVQKQLETCRKWVRQYRNHPALLMWGLGNEMEGDGKNPRIWQAVNAIARMVKEEDPNHPTLTVIAEIGQDKARQAQAFCPDVDVLGINSYGGAASLSRRLKAQGWTKPYIVTEFGPLGPWEARKTSWSAPVEPTSTQKAETYLANYYRAVGFQEGWALGSYVFLWGNKQEATATWFGMLLPTGEKLAPVDAMTYAWTGKWPVNRCPQILAVDMEADAAEVAPGATLTARVAFADPDNDTLTTRWEVVSENTDRKEGGDFEKDPPAHPAAILTAQQSRVRFRAPQAEGAYRLFLTVTDGKGSAATANIPFLVKPGTAARR